MNDLQEKFKKQLEKYSKLSKAEKIKTLQGIGILGKNNKLTPNFGGEDEPVVNENITCYDLEFEEIDKNDYQIKYRQTPDKYINITHSYVGKIFTAQFSEDLKPILKKIGIKSKNEYYGNSIEECVKDMVETLKYAFEEYDEKEQFLRRLASK